VKEKNDFQQDSEPDVIHPTECIYCHHTEMEQVQIHGAYGRAINRMAEMTSLGKLFPGLAKPYALYGWRCMECGYVMWFTARYLD